MTECVFCRVELEPRQNILLENEYCLFLQLDEVQIKGSQLEGFGLIVPKKHRQTAFDLTEEEWKATYHLLQQVKEFIDLKHRPDGYNLDWNCGEIEEQHIPHAHLHVIPRYADEVMAGKGIRQLFKGPKNKRQEHGRESYVSKA